MRPAEEGSLAGLVGVVKTGPHRQQHSAHGLHVPDEKSPIVHSLDVDVVCMQVRWYYVLVAGLVTPPCALANAFGTALVDQVMLQLMPLP